MDQAGGPSRLVAACAHSGLKGRAGAVRQPLGQSELAIGYTVQSGVESGGRADPSAQWSAVAQAVAGVRHKSMLPSTA